MLKLYLPLFLFLLTLSGCEGILDSYDEHFGPTVNLWGEEYSVKNTIDLDLANTGLTGSIPSKIGDLENLERIYLSRNQLSGEIPLEIGYLTNLTSLILNDNQLTGEIPLEFGNLTNLRYLNLDNNQLSGEISENICDLSIIWSRTQYGLTTAYSSVEDNQFCPPYPLCISDFTSQDISNCWDCEEDGVVELWGNCYSIAHTTMLDLSNSGLTGSIQIEIGSLTNLEKLLLHENQLTGDIPSEIWDLTNLNNLNLSYNSLTGSIPPGIGNLTNLKYLDLSNNSLTGSIPLEVGNLTNIYKLKLNNNLLSGIIPEIICELELRWYSEVFLDIFGQPVSSVKDNRLCPPYPSCLNGNYFVNGLGPYSIIGNQNTSNCN